MSASSLKILEGFPEWDGRLMDHRVIHLVYWATRIRHRRLPVHPGSSCAFPLCSLSYPTQREQEAEDTTGHQLGRCLGLGGQCSAL
jgi:hypothetical protein